MSQPMIDAAKAVDMAYNDKNWNAVKGSVSPGFVYDEFGTQRKIQGADQFLAAWQGWATAFPDSKATIQSAHVSGNTVVLELTWSGTHNGPLQMPGGPIAATGKKFNLPACQVIEIADGKVKSMHHYFDMSTLSGQLGINA